MAVNDLITFRKGTASQWISANPVLASGEPGYDLTNSILKIGNGVSNWVALSGIGSTSVGGGGSSSTSVIEYGSVSNFPVSGVGSTIYISTDNGRIYRWASTVYQELGPVSYAPIGSDSRWNLFLPAAPADLTVTNGNAQATLSWTAPTGVIAQAPIQDYREQYSTDNGMNWTTVSAAASTATTATIGSLTNGQAVQFRVAAVNEVGVGPYTASSAAIAIGTPAAPTGLTATIGSAQVSLTWTAPSNNGGSSITDYRVQFSSNSGSSWTTFSSRTVSTTASQVVTGLTNGTAYVFRVAGVNANGTGTYTAASSSVTPTANIDVQYLVIAGGGSGGNVPTNAGAGGGGGAGGFIEGVASLTPGTSYNITVGAGGTVSSNTTDSGNTGNNSTFSNITASGGGGGGSGSGSGGGTGRAGKNGGSGGGGGYRDFDGGLSGGLGNTPSTTPAQGFNGGSGGNDFPFGAGGGGGSGAVGGSGHGGSGGTGKVNTITGQSVYYAGGGGGGNGDAAPGSGGLGGGGDGAKAFVSAAQHGSAAKGGGGGGGSNGRFFGGQGGSGVVIIRASRAAAATTGSPTVSTVGSDTVYTFTGTGSITF
jgi:hypothetical protein